MLRPTAILSLAPSLTGLAVSTPSKLLRLQTYGEKRLHSVHAGCVGCLSGPQCARTASSGMETLLQVTILHSLRLNMEAGCMVEYIYSSCTYPVLRFNLLKIHCCFDTSLSSSVFNVYNIQWFSQVLVII